MVYFIGICNVKVRRSLSVKEDSSMTKSTYFDPTMKSEGPEQGFVSVGDREGKSEGVNVGPELGAVDGETEGKSEGF